MNHEPGWGWRAVLLGGIVAFSVGVGLTVLLRPMPAPGWIETAMSGAQTISVAPESFADERAIPVKLATTNKWVGLSPTDGVLRNTTCTPGGALVSGQAPFLINDQLVVLLGLSSPPWRDFEIGLKGEDVKALQEELKQLGYLDTQPDGNYGTGTGKAVSALWAAIGGDPKQTGIPITQMLWLPNEQVTPVSCPATIGTAITKGQELFTVGGGISSLNAQFPPGQIPGDRLAVVGETTIPLPKDGVISDPAFLEAFSKSVKYQLYLKDPATELSITARLVDPLQVFAVPASALYQAASPTACILSSGKPLEVTIVGSQFGTTLVQADGLTGQIDAAPSKDSPPCK